LRRLTEGEELLAFCFGSSHFLPLHLKKDFVRCDSRSDFNINFGWRWVIDGGSHRDCAKRPGATFASLTVYHDFQPKDKQEAIEIVMGKKAGKKMEEVESGEDK
jgi:hypothetical protein